MSMHEDNSASQRPSATGLFRSLTNLLSTLVTLAQTRLELLTTELQEEISRAAAMLVWTFVALFCVGIGLFMLGFAIIIAFWDTHRLLAAVLVTLGFFVLASAAALALRAKIRGKPRLLDATRTELERDRDQLASRL